MIVKFTDSPIWEYPYVEYEILEEISDPDVTIKNIIVSNNKHQISTISTIGFEYMNNDDYIGAHDETESEFYLNINAFEDHKHHYETGSPWLNFYMYYKVYRRNSQIDYLINIK